MVTGGNFMALISMVTLGGQPTSALFIAQSCRGHAWELVGLVVDLLLEKHDSNLLEHLLTVTTTVKPPIWNTTLSAA